MKKKGLAKTLVLLAAAGVLTGCASGGTQKETETSAVTEKVSEAAESEAATEAASEAAESEAVTEAVSEEAESEAVTETAGSTSVLGETVSAAGWNITVEDVQKNHSMENVSVELGYTGVETSDYQKEAGEGKIFCLIKMKIEKDGSKETIQWENLKLTDSTGTEYTRMADEFLTELGMKRMPGNALNFGSNEGWIAFEIDEEADGLVLQYTFDAEMYQAAL